MNSMKGKVCVVAGATQGLGAAIARRLAAAGAAGIVATGRNEARGGKLAREIADRYSLIVFPEGTRSRTGRVARFKRGSFYLALQAGLPVVPLSIVGSRHVMLRGRVATYPGRVRLVVHPPIDTSGLAGSDARAFAERVRQIIVPIAESDLARQPPDIQAA